MHHDAVPEATEPIDTHESTPTPTSQDPQGPVRDLCMSVFDRWRCTREDGHDGLHASGDDGMSATWNDGAAGRRLRWR